MWSERREAGYDRIEVVRLWLLDAHWGCFVDRGNANVGEDLAKPTDGKTEMRVPVAEVPPTCTEVGSTAQEALRSFDRAFAQDGG